MKYFKPTTVAQKRKYHKIVKARPGQFGYKQQIKKWNHYARRAYWYVLSSAKYKRHLRESLHWSKSHPGKTKHYRLRSYFRRFTDKLAYPTDLQEELKWAARRQKQLINSHIDVAYHRLPRNSDFAGAKIKDDKKRRMHHQYRSYAHRYIISILRLDKITSIKKHILERLNN